MIAAIHKSMAAKRDAIKNDEQGFTLIELLVVVLIIGILTAIAVPVFIGQQQQAQNAAAQSDLGVAKVALVSAYTADPAGTPTLADLQAFGYANSAGVTPVDLTGVLSSTNFCLTNTSANGTDFQITATAAVSEGDCS